MIEKMVGTCTLEGTAEPRAAKATWSFEYFTLLQKLNHIRIEEGGNSHPLTHAQRQELLALCYQTDKLDFARIRKVLDLRRRRGSIWCATGPTNRRMPVRKRENHRPALLSQNAQGAEHSAKGLYPHGGS